MISFIKNPLFLVIISGIAAGAWPLVMQKSGLTGAPVAVVYSLISLVAAGILLGINGGLRSVFPSISINWWWAIGAGILAALALVLLSSVVGKVPPTRLSLLYVVMMAVQILVPAVFFVVVNQGINLKQALGFVAAVVAALLLM